MNSLAEKLNLPPQVVQTVVAFVLGKLIGQRMQPEVDNILEPSRSQADQPQGSSMEDVVRKMNAGEQVTKAEIRSSGLAEELAEESGMDLDTAEVSLQEVLNALGDQLYTAE